MKTHKHTEHKKRECSILTDFLLRKKIIKKKERADRVLFIFSVVCLGCSAALSYNVDIFQEKEVKYHLSRKTIESLPPQIRAQITK